MTLPAASSPDLWLVRPRRVAIPRVRVFCFPHAGGGPAAFRPWVRDVPEDVEFCLVQLPGREGRWRETPYTNVGDAVAALSGVVRAAWTDNVVFFGHSLGGLIAFLLARQLRREHGVLPHHLICSAHRAPHLPSRHPTIRHLDDDAFIAEMSRRYGGVPQAVLDNRELLQLMLPCLRADFTSYETYQYEEDTPLACPISAFGGTADPFVVQSEVEGWRRHTTAACTTQMLDGDHFFVQSHRATLLAAMAGAGEGATL